MKCISDLIEFQQLALEYRFNPHWLLQIADTTNNSEIQWLAYSLLKNNHTNYQ